MHEQQINESECTSCQERRLVKSGTPCHCGGQMRPVKQDMLRKAFAAEDTDLRKSGR